MKDEINGLISTQIQLSNLIFHKGTRLRIKKFQTEYFMTIIAYFNQVFAAQFFDNPPNPVHSELF